MRYDASRVLLVLEPVAPFPLDPDSARLPAPAGQCGPLTSWVGLSPDDAAGIAANPPDAGANFAPPASFAPGDTFAVLLGGTSAVVARVTGLVGYSGTEAAYLGALATITAADQARYAAAPADCFLARVPVPGHTAAPPPPAASPTAPDAAQISKLLAAQLARDLPAIAAEDVAGTNLGMPAVIAPVWRQRDAALASGQGALTTRIEPVRLPAAGGVRFYVQALWTVAGTPAFVETAWLNPSPALHVQFVDTAPASAMRIAEYQGNPPGMDLLPELRNAIDLGDGQLALLFVRATVADSGLELEFYRDTGLVRTGLFAADAN